LTSNPSKARATRRLLLIGALWAGYAVALDITPDTVGVRAGTNAGDDSRSHLERYDVVAGFELPWAWPLMSSFHLATQLDTSLGLLRNGGGSTLIASLSPGVVLGGQTGNFQLAASAGIALVPDYRLGEEDFGGPVQFTFGFGLGFRVHESFLLGYRAQHFSDAGIYGSNNRGVDMHMLELTYRPAKR
jgi:hypothetical protein